MSLVVDDQSYRTEGDIAARRSQVAEAAAARAAKRAETLIECQRVLAQPVRTMADLARAVAARRQLLGLRQLEVDELSGMPSGYQGKVEAGVKNWGPLSFEYVLAALKAELYLVPKVD